MLLGQRSGDATSQLWMVVQGQGEETGDIGRVRTELMIQDLRSRRPRPPRRALSLHRRDDNLRDGQTEPRELLPFRHVE